MREGEEVKARLSQPEEIELWVLISQVRKELLTASDRELKRLGVTTVQLGILHALRNSQEVGVLPNLSDLSRWVMRKHNTVSVILGSMEKRGLVQLERPLKGKRTVRVSITEKGLAIYDEHMKRRKAASQILGCLTPQERDQLKTLLEKLDRQARDILSRVPFL